MNTPVDTSNYVIARRVAAMLQDLQVEVLRRLDSETDPDERKQLQWIYDQVPGASLVIGFAAGLADTPHWLDNNNAAI